MKEKQKIIMLPTEDKEARLVRNAINDKLLLDVGQVIPINAKPQHLYILSDDKIKKGDWSYNTSTSKVIQAQFTRHKKDYAKKIIATTDPGLGKYIDGNNPMIGEFIGVSLPQIPQSLTEYYAKHQPEEVELEYEVIERSHACQNCSSELPYIKCTCAQGIRKYQETTLKLRDNEVVWVEPKEKLYTRAEVEKLIRLAWIGGGKDCNSGRFDGPDGFIKENL